MATGTAHATLQPLQARATGYVHGSAYASAVAAFPDLERQELVRAMPPTFQALADPILHIIATGAEPAGPYLGNPNLPEKMLQAFAEYEQGERTIETLELGARCTGRHNVDPQPSGNACCSSLVFPPILT